MKRERIALAALTDLGLQHLENDVTTLTVLGMIANKLGMPEEIPKILARLESSKKTALRVEQKLNEILEDIHGKGH